MSVRGLSGEAFPRVSSGEHIEDSLGFESVKFNFDTAAHLPEVDIAALSQQQLINTENGVPKPFSSISESKLRRNFRRISSTGNEATSESDDFYSCVNYFASPMSTYASPSWFSRRKMRAASSISLGSINDIQGASRKNKRSTRARLLASKSEDNRSLDSDILPSVDERDVEVEERDVEVEEVEEFEEEVNQNRDMDLESNKFLDETSTTISDLASALVLTKIPVSVDALTLVLSTSQKQLNRSQNGILKGKGKGNEKRGVPYSLQALHRPAESKTHEAIVLRVVVPDDKPRVKAERVLSLTDVTRSVYTAIDAHVMNVNHVAMIKEITNEPNRRVDLSAIRKVVQRIFQESDDDGNKHLTLNELMIQLSNYDTMFTNLLNTITNREISALIAEAEMHDGRIYYQDYVPFAVDMILAFRARNFAKRAVDQYLIDVEKEVKETMHKEDIYKTIEAYMSFFKVADSAGKGVLKIADFKACCAKVNAFSDPLESALIRKTIPRDSFGKIVYSSFPGIFQQARFTVLKKRMIEYRGSRLEQALFAECKAAEEKHYVPETVKNFKNLDAFVHLGRMDSRDLTDTLTSSKHIQLSHLHVNIVLSAMIFEHGALVGAHVDYYDYIPFLSRFLEEVARPENAAQRESMIRASDLEIDVNDEEKKYTTQELSVLANLLLSDVHLKPFRTSIGDKIHILLPEDEPILLASKMKEILPFSSPETKAEGNGSDSSSQHAQITLKALYSPYNGDNIILRAINESVVTTCASKGVVCERVVAIDKVITHLRRDKGAFESFLSKWGSCTMKQIEFIGKVVLEKLCVRYLNDNCPYAQQSQGSATNSSASPSPIPIPASSTLCSSSNTGSGGGDGGGSVVVGNGNGSSSGSGSGSGSGIYGCLFLLLPGEKGSDLIVKAAEGETTRRHSAVLANPGAGAGEQVVLFRGHTVVPISLLPHPKNSIARLRRQRTLHMSHVSLESISNTGNGGHGHGHGHGHGSFLGASLSSIIANISISGSTSVRSSFVSSIQNRLQPLQSPSQLVSETRKEIDEFHPAGLPSHLPSGPSAKVSTKQSGKHSGKQRSPISDSTVKRKNSAIIDALMASEENDSSGKSPRSLVNPVKCSNVILSPIQPQPKSKSKSPAKIISKSFTSPMSPTSDVKVSSNGRKVSKGDISLLSGPSLRRSSTEVGDFEPPIHYSPLIQSLSSVDLDDIDSLDSPQIKDIPVLVTVRVAKPDEIGDCLATTKPLYVSAMAVDGSYSFSGLQVQVKLPTLMMLDNQVASSFAASFVSRLYIKVPPSWNGEQFKIELNVKDL